MSPSTFTGIFGAVQYKSFVHSRDYRTRAAVVAYCEISTCAAVDQLVIDHCHEHGWVRGVICQSHNVRLGQIDAVRGIEGVRLDMSRTELGNYLRNCHECAESPAGGNNPVTFISDRPCRKGHRERYRNSGRCAICMRRATAKCRAARRATIQNLLT